METALHPLESADGTLCIVGCRHLLGYDSEVMVKRRSVWENCLEGGVGYFRTELEEGTARKRHRPSRTAFDAVWKVFGRYCGGFEIVVVWEDEEWKSQTCSR